MWGILRGYMRKIDMLLYVKYHFAYTPLGEGVASNEVRARGRLSPQKLKKGQTSVFPYVCQSFETHESYHYHKYLGRELLLPFFYWK